MTTTQLPLTSTPMDPGKVGSSMTDTPPDLTDEELSTLEQDLAQQHWHDSRSEVRRLIAEVRRRREAMALLKDPPKLGDTTVSAYDRRVWTFHQWPDGKYGWGVLDGYIIERGDGLRCWLEETDEGLTNLEAEVLDAHRSIRSEVESLIAEVRRRRAHVCECRREHVEDLECDCGDSSFKRGGEHYESCPLNPRHWE